MTQAQSLIGVVLSLIVGALMLTLGSANSIGLEYTTIFVACGAIGFLLHWLIFIPSYIAKTDHYFDLTGSVSYITTVVVALYLNPKLDIRDMVIASMVIIWALRLGSFLFWRVKTHGKDSRFDVMKTKFTWFLLTWTLGGLWVLVTLAAGLAAMSSTLDKPLGILAYTGIGIWLFGFLVETIADYQKTQFRKLPENTGRFINVGLWRWSRHPNYFGEIVLWLGLSLVALPVLSGWQLATMISPVFVYLLLTRISGINLLERQGQERWGNDPEYLLYKQSTSRLILRKPSISPPTGA